jgi:hypothetical protein
MALDGLYNFGATGLTTAFTSAFHGLGRGGVLVIPSIQCDAPAAYVSAVQRLRNRYAPGLLVKATLRQLAGVTAWVAGQGWPTADIDLVITAGHVADFDPVLFEQLVENAMRGALTAPQMWRSITLASSAAPKDYSAFPVGSTDVPRLDWQLWQNVHPSVQYQLDYGDYGIAHPDLTEPPGVAMVRATVSLRYTVDDFWIIQKGRATTGAHGQPMPRQYLAHARSLVTDGRFGGLPGCWADQRISQIAAATMRPGSRTTWVENGANRHLSLVVDRLP